MNNWGCCGWLLDGGCCGVVVGWWLLDGDCWMVIVGW